VKTKIDKANLQDIFELNMVQKGMLFQYLKDETSNIYNVQLTLYVSGEVDIQLFREALNILQKNNEALRSVFRWEEATKPLQIILRDKPVGCVFKDFSMLKAADRDRATDRYLLQDKDRRFDLEQEAFRVSLLKKTDQEYELVLTHNHILYDGWSTGILVKELTEVYNRLLKQEEIRPVFKPQMKDVAREVSSNKPDSSLEKNYWSKYLHQFMPVLLDTKANEEGAGEICKYKLGMTDAGLFAYAAREKVTAAAVIYAAYGVLLQSYTFSTDIVFGSTVSGRSATTSGIENLIGNFINTCPLRLRCSPDMTLRDIVKNVNEDLIDKVDYQDTSYGELKQFFDLGPADDLFNSVVVIENYPLDIELQNSESAIKFSLKSVYEHTEIPLVVSVYFRERPELEFCFDSGKFSQDFIEGLARCFERVLNDFINLPDSQIGALRILPLREEAELLVGFRGPVRELPAEKTVLDLFREQVKRTPEGLALSYEESTLSYASLDKLSDQIASYLIGEKGVKRGDLIGIDLDRDLYVIAFIFGILKSGAGYVPLSGISPAGRSGQIVEDTGMRLMISRNAERYAGVGCYLNPEEELAVIRSYEYQGLSEVSGTDVAYVLYTSGSTGKPKGVVVNHLSLLNYITWASDEYFGGEVRTFGFITSLTFDLTVTSVFSPLVNGSNIRVYGEDFSLDLADRLLRENATDIIKLTPTHLQLLLQSGEVISGAGNRLQTFIVGGEALKRSVASGVSERFGSGVRILNEYGPTEATVGCMLYAYRADDVHQSVPIGVPGLNVQVYIMDRYGRIVPSGVAGELYISGDCLASGYLNDAEQTASRFLSDASGGRIYRTGDLARRLGDGNLEYLGRMDNQVKIRGYRIELGEIEHVMSSYGGIRESVVVVHERGEDRYLAGYYVSEVPVDEKGLRSHLQGLLPEYMVPSYYQFLDRLPVTGNGKLDRKGLPEPEFSGGGDYEGAVTAGEHQMVKIWSEVLNVPADRLSMNGSFFDLGGHSLNVTFLINRIAKVFNCRLTVPMVFAMPTIRQLVMQTQRVMTDYYTPIYPAPVSDHYPVSSVQKRMFSIQQMDVDSITYNMSYFAELKGSVDLERLESAFVRLVDRHAILRTRFTLKGDEVVQEIRESADFRVSITEGREEEVGVLLEAFIRPFELSSDILMRVCVIVISREHHILAVDMHHIISDGVSMGILIGEFMSLYSGAELSSPRLEYKDYAEWQQGQSGQAFYESDRKYWESVYSSVPDSLELPSDYVRPSVKQDGGGVVQFSLAEGMGASLASLAEREGVTMFMLLLSLYNILLSRLGNQSDLVVGVPVSGREHSDVEGMIGMFVNTLALRTQVDGAMRFSDYLSELKQDTLSGFEHQGYPYEALVEGLELGRDTSRNPLFDVMFSYENFEQPDLVLPGLELSGYDAGHRVSKFDLTLSAGYSSGELRFGLEYASSLYSEGTILRFRDYFLELISSVLSDSDSQIGALRILPLREEAELLVGFRGPVRELPAEKTVLDLFREQVKRTPEALALSYEGVEITYAELDRYADSLAMNISEYLDHQSGKNIGLFFNPSMTAIIAMVAVLKSGNTFVPLSPGLPEERNRYILENCGASLLLSEKNMFASETENQIFDTVKTLIIGPENMVTDNRTYAGHQFNGAPMYIIYTSGTTGLPKGVIVDHPGVVNLCCAFQDMYQIKKQTRVSQIANIFFDASVFEIWPCLLNGGTLFIAAEEIRKDPLLLKSWIEQNEIEILFLPTGIADYMLSTGTFNAGKLKIMNVAGDRFNYVPSKPIPFRLFNLYGPTEDSVWTTSSEVKPGEAATYYSIGKPIANKTVRILNRDLKIQPIGVTGELCISGFGVARGYINNAALSSERFISDPYGAGGRLYRTGDLARWLADGNLEYMGRMDEQVKIRGYRIELGEIESQLCGYPGILENVVLARGEQGSRYLVAYYRGSGLGGRRSVRDYLSSRLPEYMIPSYFVHMDHFPLTPNGKLDKKSLPEPEVVSEEVYVSPRNAVEIMLSGIWSKVLGVDNIGITDNFFALGGDSIKSIQISSRIRQSGYGVTVKDILVSQTIEKLSPKVSPLITGSDQSAVSGPVVLSPIQEWFFSGDRTAAHHFNQSVLLNFPSGLSKASASRIFSRLQDHHDALRMVFHESGRGMLQENREAGLPVLLEEYDLSGFADGTGELQRRSSMLQGGIDLSEGPLMRLGLYHLGGGSRLLIVIHHLVIDAVSWRVLLEDLDTLYRQEVSGEVFSLPAKTDSYRSWTTGLVSYSGGKAFSQAMSYWSGLGPEIPAGVPRDYPSGENKAGGTGSVSFELSRESTSVLLTGIHSAFNTQINDLLLTGLALGLQSGYGLSSQQIDLEGHGREPLVPGVDISRTIGWFTSIHPVLLEVQSGGVIATLKHIKETLRQIPNKGLDYQISRYLGGNPLGVEGSGTGSRISFNYLGQFDSATSDTVYELAQEQTGATISGERDRSHDWEISGMVASGQLKLTLTYSRGQYKDEGIRRFMSFYKEQLLLVIAGCQGQNRRELTPSDLSYKGLSMSQVEALSQRWDIQDIYPLSAMQEGMLFHSLLDSSSDEYFEQVSCHMSGAWAPKEVELSMNRLIGRYDILRTVFLHEEYSRPLQVVLRERKIAFSYHDVRAECAELPRETVLSRYKAEDRSNKFELSRDVLIRLTLLRSGSEEYEFIWSFHHILMDGWCMGIIINDFRALYGSASTGTPVQLPAVRPYADYISWLEGRDREESLSYWQQYLSGYESTAQLPAAEKRLPGEHQTSRLLMGEERMKELHKVSRLYGVTLNTIIQGAWGILLSRYNHSEDVVFGSVVSGRPSEIPGIEQMVGLFINTVPVRMRQEPEDEVGGYLQRAQAAALESERYHYEPLSETQSLSLPGRALLNHILIFENYPLSEELEGELTGGRISEVSMFERTNYDLSLTIVPGSELQIQAGYSGKYSRSTIEGALRHLDNILAGFSSAEGKLVGEIDMLGGGEREELLYGFNETAAAYPRERNIIELFSEQVASHPHRTAVSFRNQSLTYSQLDELSGKMATYLKKCRQIESGENIGLILERSLEMVAWILGVLKAGCAYVPIDPQLPLQRMDTIISDAMVNTLIIDAAIDTELLSCPLQMIIVADTAELISDLSPAQPVLAGADSTVYIMYTSGSTGNPKGIPANHYNITRLVKNANYIEIKPEDKIIQWSNYVFDGSTFDIYGALLNGAELVVIPREATADITLLGQALLQEEISIMFITTALFNALAEYGLHYLHGIRKLLTGGEKASRKHIEKALGFLGPDKLIHVYGPTESTVFSSYFPINTSRDIADAIPIGKPVSNTRIYIVDHNLNLIPKGVTGQICIAGDGLANGYINNDDLSKQKFVPDPFSYGNKMYLTGDYGMWLDGGNVDFSGRVDDQVKIRGYRIEVGEIESVLAGFSDLKEVLVVALNKENEKYIATYYVADREISYESFYDFLQARLPQYMIPAHYVRLDHFPLTPNGKIDKKALPDPRDEEGDGNVQLSGAEKQLAGIWSEVLKMNPLNIRNENHFFELGGHSIKAIYLSNAIRDGFKVDMPLKAIFAKPVFAEMLAYIKSLDRVAEDRLVKIPVKDHYMTSSAQQRLYFQQSMNPLDLSANIAVALEIKGDFDTEKVTSVFNELIQRHESLRTSFTEINGELFQTIHHKVPFILKELPMQASALETVFQSFIKPFDLSVPGMIRASVYRDRGKNYLFLELHHIICDGFSLNMLISDFRALYAGNLLTALLYRYVDFAAWQQSGILGASDSQTYWAEKLSGGIPRLELPLLQKRNTVGIQPAASIRLDVGESTTAKMIEVCASLGISEFTLLLSVTKLLFYKVTGSTDIIIGTDVTGRSHEAIRNIIGTFVNVLPIRSRLNPEDSLAAFFKNVQAEVLDALSHQDFQIERINSLAREDSDEYRNAIFDVHFTLSNTIDNLPGTDDFWLVPLDLRKYVATQYELKLEAARVSSGYHIFLVYSTLLYDADTIGLFSQYYEAILLNALQNPDVTIADLEIEIVHNNLISSTALSGYPY
jgi:bacitracin synthase 3